MDGRGGTLDACALRRLVAACGPAGLRHLRRRTRRRQFCLPPRSWPPLLPATRPAAYDGQPSRAPAAPGRPPGPDPGPAAVQAVDETEQERNSEQTGDDELRALSTRRRQATFGRAGAKSSLSTPGQLRSQHDQSLAPSASVFCVKRMTRKPPC